MAEPIGGHRGWPARAAAEPDASRQGVIGKVTVCGSNDGESKVHVIFVRGVDPHFHLRKSRPPARRLVPGLCSDVSGPSDRFVRGFRRLWNDKSCEQQHPASYTRKLFSRFMDYLMEMRCVRADERGETIFVAS